MSDIVPSELRACRTCGKLQPASEYYVRSKYRCKSCHRKAARERGLQNSSRFKQGNLSDVPEVLKCSICRNVKPISEFKKNKHNPLGHQRQCLHCYKFAQSRNTRSSKLAKYDLTIEQYDEMLKQQDGRCAICKQLPKDGRYLLVDHDHQTGKTRALLCDSCNARLGYLERITLIELENFLSYVRYHSGKAS